MEDLKMAAEVAVTTRNEIVETAAARGVQGWCLAIRTETMAKVADNAVIASGHSRLFLSVNEVHWPLREGDVVVMQTVTKVLPPPSPIAAAVSPLPRAGRQAQRPPGRHWPASRVSGRRVASGTRTPRRPARRKDAPQAAGRPPAGPCLPCRAGALVPWR